MRDRGGGMCSMSQDDEQDHVSGDAAGWISTAFSTEQWKNRSSARATECRVGLSGDGESLFVAGDRLCGLDCTDRGCGEACAVLPYAGNHRRQDVEARRTKRR